MLSPTSPPVIRGTGGLRKMRFAPPSWHTGKRGALRVCYVFLHEHAIVLLVGFYAKNEREDLTAQERKDFAVMIKDIQEFLEEETTPRGKR